MVSNKTSVDVASVKPRAGKSPVALGVLTPHPPLLIPEIGSGYLPRVKATEAAMREVAEAIVATQPDAIVVMSPHGPVFADAIAINLTPQLRGGFGGFGARETLSFPNDLVLAKSIMAAIEERDIAVADFGPESRVNGYKALELDHGVLVPMHFIHAAGYTGPLVSLTMGFLPVQELFEVGKAIQTAVEGRSVVVLASGDLSHRLTPDAPAGFDPSGEGFDREIMRLLGEGDVQGVLRIKEDLREAAGECGYRTIVMMLGALDGWPVESRVLSYEGPFGVGYGVAVLAPRAQG